MLTRLAQISERVDALETLAGEVGDLAQRMLGGGNVQPALSQKGEKWYRGARELLARYEFSGLDDFDECYRGPSFTWGLKPIFHGSYTDLAGSERFAHIRRDFDGEFLRARGLLNGLLEEMRSRELLAASQLSFAIAANEFDTAKELLDAARGDEAVVRAAGVVARIALERHLFTVGESRNIPIAVNPPTKKKAEAQDVITSLLKSAVINSVQQSQLLFLFKVGNNCAHPKEAVRVEEVEKLVTQGKELSAVIA